MVTAPRAAIAAGLCVAALAAACASAPKTTLHQTPPTLGRNPYTDADVDFMAGMIPHHAQAVVMAGWCGSHGARQDVAIFCGPIFVARRRAVAGMRAWG